MKGVLVTQTRNNVKRINPFTLFLKNTYVPAQAGFVAFTSLIILIFVLRIASYIMGNTENVMLDFMDLALALVGFILVFSSKFLENFGKINRK